MKRALLVTVVASLVCFAGCDDESTSVDAGGADAGGSDAGAAATDAGPGASDAGPRMLRMFVTSRSFSGDLGGRSGADGLCELVARDAGLEGRFVAFIAGTQPGGRYTGHERVPADNVWYRVDGMPINDSWLTIRFNEPLLVAPNLDERGNPVPADAFVWTGIGRDGDPAIGEDCASPDFVSWDYDTGNSAFVGRPNDVERWSSDTDVPCSNEGHLYCFEI